MTRKIPDRDDWPDEALGNNVNLWWFEALYNDGRWGREALSTPIREPGELMPVVWETIQTVEQLLESTEPWEQDLEDALREAAFRQIKIWWTA